ncbi:MULTISPECIES: hypothetical protein [Streptomyces]|uniref:Thioredoxin n=1 Tax=Streptomyces virginiae TaxID=1961 RepID=A0ABQ3NHB5_STRVG|nr:MULTISPECIES: hypothetical protein [Streptomyces]KOU22003.1 hypothetical protein ADK49_08580 [Streptomyces sp. WM6349]KOU82022.1 hypothetical protein ADK94_25560 [Streptomyces sp. XY593]KOU98763.1 hypothetical protein ADK92_13585 [Streptomyces sp. XY533]KOV00618.1 hypothetical protein ADK91_25775 [Streptomyces sp. XY511]KOV45850.1 hypothetical protein ADK98_14060 [Streptomyces sp. H036]
MSAAVDAREAGRRVEEVLDRLAGTGDREACEAAEELVRVLMEFYGAGLARIAAKLGDGPLAAAADDELVASLLSLHGLHPEDVHTRIARALAGAPDPVELLGFDESTGVLRLRPAAAPTGCGCGPGGAETARRTLEDTLTCFAPEVTSVEMEPAPDPQPALLQIGTRPHSPARVS